MEANYEFTFKADPPPRTASDHSNPAIPLRSKETIFNTAHRRANHERIPRGRRSRGWRITRLNIEKLPDEIIHKIIKNLWLFDIWHFALSCRRMYDASQNLLSHQIPLFKRYRKWLEPTVEADDSPMSGLHSSRRIRTVLISVRTL